MTGSAALHGLGLHPGRGKDCVPSFLSAFFGALRCGAVVFLTVTIVHAQPEPEMGRTVAENVPRSVLVQDSLELHLLEIDIAKARLAATESDFWHRLIPRVGLTASFGVREILFFDPTSSVPYLLPNDAYRLTFTLPLSDLFNSTKHAGAELDLERLQTESAKLIDHQLSLRALLAKKQHAVDMDRAMLNEEIRMTAEVVRFKQMLFEEGKIHYDALIKSKLDLLNLKRNLNRLNREISGLDLADEEGSLP